MSDWLSDDMWAPIEVTVKADDSVEVSYGPKHFSTLKIRVTDKADLWDFDVVVTQNGQELPNRSSQTWDGSDEWYDVVVVGTGPVTIKITHDDFEPWQREITLKEGETPELAVELKRKQ